MSDTKAHILSAALDAFAKQGYHATSIQDLADAVGVTKPAVLYHFATKADILAELARPMLDALDGALDAAARADDPRWATLESLLDVFIAHRYLLRMNLSDLAFVTNAAFVRYRDAMYRANALVAGKEASFADRVLAAQALATLGDPIVLYADAPVERLREAVLAGPRRLLGWQPPATRGRRKLLDHREAERARRAYAQGSSVADIAAKLGISRASVYRYLSQK